MHQVNHATSVRGKGFAVVRAILIAALLLPGLQGCRGKGGPTDPIAAIYRARASARLGVNDTVAAGRFLSKAEQLDPDSSETQVLIGEVLRREGNLDLAEARYRRALELEPRSAEARLNLGALCGQKGDLDEALRQFRIVADDKHFERRDLAHDNIGQICLEKKDLDCAEKEFRQAVALNDRYARSRANLGKVESLQGNHQAAADQLAAAVKLDPNFVEARYRLALAYVRLGRRADAIAELRNVLRIAPRGTYARDARQELALLE